MQLKEADSEFSLVKEEGVFLNGEALAEILSATFSKQACFRFKARGFSMFPFIRDNDILTVSPLSLIEPSFGQAVAFIHPATNKLVVHRIVGSYSGSYLIKGDNSLTPDGIIPMENILGCVSKIERDGRPILVSLGKERFFIGWLSRKRFFPLCFWVGRAILPEALRKKIKTLIRWR